jgi:hypothetical protein
MSSPKTRPACRDQPRPFTSVLRLRQALGLNDEDWQSYLWHARHGFSDYEKDRFIDPRSTLRLREVPAQWFEETEAIGFVSLRVLKEGEKSLGIPVAQHLLRICDPGEFHDPVPPGTGQAWLHLTRAGLAPPIDTARLSHLALSWPAEFFKGVAEDDLPDLCRLILEGQSAIEAWDMHAVFAAVVNAQIHARAPFRLFEKVMAADWLTIGLKREFCRGLLGCDPESEHLLRRFKAVRASFQAGDDLAFKIPRAWLDLSWTGIGGTLPTLKRHAVFALVENVGEPLPEVIHEFFLRRDHLQQSIEAVTEGVLDLIGFHAEELGLDVVRKRLGKAVKCAIAPLRQAAYGLGAEHFGVNFVRPALRDKSRMVRDWAIKLLKTKEVTPARKVARKKRATSKDQ